MRRAGWSRWIIEAILLVVVVLVGLGLLFSASVGPSNASPNAKTKNEIFQIANALRQYKQTRGQFPVEQGPDDITLASDNRRVIKALIDPQSGLPFLEALPAVNGRGGVAPEGTFLDPWGAPYYIRLDTNSDGKVENPASPEAGPARLNKDVIVWSWGKLGRRGTSERQQRNAVYSWQ